MTSSVVETAEHDVKTLIKRLKDHIKTGKQITEDICHLIFAEGKLEKYQVGEELYKRCRDEGYNENEVKVVREQVPSEFKDHSNDPKSPPTNWTLESLSVATGIDDEEFNKLRNSTHDTVPQLAKHDLTEAQLDQLSPATLQEYSIKRKKELTKVKGELHGAELRFETKMQERGLQIETTPAPIETLVPPTQLWGKNSAVWKICDAFATEHEIWRKYWLDVRDIEEKFVSPTELQQEQIEHIIKFRDNVQIPIANAVMFLMETNRMIMEHLVDEKYGETFERWLKIANDKFWSFGNHGSGELNSVLTGKYTYSLKTNQYEIDEAIELGNPVPEPCYIVVETGVLRPFTREQSADQTTFQFDDIRSLNCEKCGFENHYRMVPIQIKESLIGDMNRKAQRIIVSEDAGNMVVHINNFIETKCDGLLTVPLRTPQQFLIEELKRQKKQATDDDIKKLKYIYNTAKIKAVDINSKTYSKIGYNVIFGRANRRADKAEHFSQVA